MNPVTAGGAAGGTPLVFYYWAFGLLVLFLVPELVAAAPHRPGTWLARVFSHGTFTEFIRWVFQVQPRPAGAVTAKLRARHLVLSAMCLILWVHFRFMVGPLPVILLGVPVAVLIVRAFLAPGASTSAPVQGKEAPPMGSLFAKLLKPLMVKFLKGNWGKLLPMLFKSAGEGQFGPTVRKIYWWTAGKKTITGMILLGAGAALETLCGSYPSIPWSCTASRVIFDVGAFLTTVGLVDGGTRSPWPQPPTLAVQEKKLPEVQVAKVEAASGQPVEVTAAKQTFFTGQNQKP